MYMFAIVNEPKMFASMFYMSSSARVPYIHIRRSLLCTEKDDSIVEACPLIANGM